MFPWCKQNSHRALPLCTGFALFCYFLPLQGFPEVHSFINHFHKTSEALLLGNPPKAPSTVILAGMLDLAMIPNTTGC